MNNLRDVAASLRTVAERLDQMQKEGIDGHVLDFLARQELAPLVYLLKDIAHATMVKP